MFKRVELGDPHGVGDHGARTRASPRPDADILILRPLDVIRDGEEVAGKAHGDNDVFLILRLFSDCVRDSLRETVVQAPLDLFNEPGSLILPFGHGEVGHVVRALGAGRELHLAAFSDLEGRITGLGQFPPGGAHVVARTDVVAVPVELETIRVCNARAGVDA